MQSVNQHDRPLEPSSINREMSCLRQMFNEAVEFGMIDRNPFNDAKSLHLKENNERNRFLTPDGARKLYKECAIHLQQIIEYVFTYQGQPVKDTKGALKTACKNAKIPYGRNEPNGITFHDLRHSYGSYLMQQRTDFRTTQELLGHKDPKMTQRYTHVIDDTKKQAVNSLNWDLHGKKSMSANVS
jgi:integrase